jgi:hypothetical protein
LRRHRGTRKRDIHARLLLEAIIIQLIGCIARVLLSVGSAVVGNLAGVRNQIGLCAERPDLPGKTS